MASTGHVCGCYFTTSFAGRDSKRYYLPPTSLDSHTILTPLYYTTRLTQTYHNSHSTSLPHVQYAFPLYDGGAVRQYTISYADKVLEGIVQEKHVAKKTYQAAVDRGETAGLLQSLPAGVFGVTLGNVPANTDIVVNISYCGELKHDAEIDGIRYTLPTSICPRYGAYPGELLGVNTVAKSGISITVDMDMSGSPIRRIESPSHPIAVSMGTLSDGIQRPFVPSLAYATLTLGSAELATDFVLQVLTDDISSPRAIVEKHPTLPNQRAVIATLVPKFTLERAYPEIVFVADQSGSMSGSKNTALVRALKVFIKSLPMGVRFNICTFGTNYRFLWPRSQAYNESNVDMAIAFVDSFTASSGGTEILPPITATFDQRHGDMPLEVMLLTDGEVWEEQSLFAYINQQLVEEKADARVFALGIGTDVSHSLVEGVARAGNGFAQFVLSGEETDQKVVRMLKGALFAHTKDYEIEVTYANGQSAEDGTDHDDQEDFEIVERVNDCLRIEDQAAAATVEKKTTTRSFFDTSAETDNHTKDNDRYAHLPTIDTPKLLQVPATIPPLFPFNRTTMYLLLGPETTQKDIASVTLRARSSQGPVELTIPVKKTPTRPGTIHQLAARKAIQDLEEGRGWLQSATVASGESGANPVLVKERYANRFDELVEREGVRLGERFQVASRWTSFVAVEDHETNDAMSVDDRPLANAIDAQARRKRRRAPSIQRACYREAVLVDNARYMSPLQNASASTHSSSSLFVPPVVQAPTLTPDSNAPTSVTLERYRREMESAACMPLPSEGDAAPVAYGGFAQTVAPRAGASLFGGNSTSSPLGAGRASAGGLFSNTSTQRQGSSLFQSMLPPSQQASGGGGLFGCVSSSTQLPSDKPLFGRLTEVHSARPSEEEEDHINEDFCCELDFDEEVEEEDRDESDSTASPDHTGAMQYLKCLDQDESDSTASPDHTAAMHYLISLQTFSGAWPLSDALLTTIGVDKTVVDLEGLDDETRATVLAIAFLENKAGDKRDVWDMVVAKAKTWLETYLSMNKNEVDGIVEKAAAFLARE